MKINWKAVGGFLKRWVPVIAEAIITKKREKREGEDVR